MFSPVQLIKKQLLRFKCLHIYTLLASMHTSLRKRCFAKWRQAISPLTEWAPRGLHTLCNATADRRLGVPGGRRGGTSQHRAWGVIKQPPNKILKPNKQKPIAVGNVDNVYNILQSFYNHGVAPHIPQFEYVNRMVKFRVLLLLFSLVSCKKPDFRGT